MAHGILFLKHGSYKFPIKISRPQVLEFDPGLPPDPDKPAPHYPGVSSIKFDAVGALKVYRTLVLLNTCGMWGKN